MFKYLGVTAAIFLFAGNSFAARVLSARMDPSNTNILIDVSYAGGCGDHTFTLKVGTCLESYPVQCSAELVEFSNDNCEMSRRETLSFSLKETGLDDPYFAGASLNILGDLDWQTEKRTSVYVKLP